MWVAKMFMLGSDGSAEAPKAPPPPPPTLHPTPPRMSLRNQNLKESDLR